MYQQHWAPPPPAVMYPRPPVRRLWHRLPPPRRVETGIDLSFLVDELESVVVEALQDDKVQAELQKTVTAIMDDPDVKRSMQPHLMSAALWISLAVAGGVVAGSAIARRFK